MERVRKILLYGIILLVGGLIAFYSAPYLRQFLFSSGILPEEVLIAGTGSMYPTFPKGEGSTDLVRAGEVVAWPKMRRFPSGISLLGINLFSYNLQHGDIVDFENEKTRQISLQKYGQAAGFVKRIVGLPGDTINLRDGFVLLSGKILDEPYTAKPRSTYGADYLADCRTITIPDGKAFVLGDNRKASLDSRSELGLIDFSDIKYVIPQNEQAEYQKTLRDTRDDISLAHTVTLDTEEFVRLLNEKRKNKGFKPLKYDKLLSLSAKRRGSVMISTDDFSTEATRSGVTLTKALNETGYRNIIFAEVFTRGFYEANELLENIFEFAGAKSLLFSGEYQDIGLSAVLGEINNCPVQVVVIHLGGFVPPNYKAEDIEGWQKLVDNLTGALSSWEQLRNADNVDQTKLEKLLVILRQRKETANQVVSRMKVNQWLSPEEEKRVSEDKNLADEANKIVEELNR